MIPSTPVCRIFQRTKFLYNCDALGISTFVSKFAKLFSVCFQIYWLNQPMFLMVHFFPSLSTSPVVFYWLNMLKIFKTTFDSSESIFLSHIPMVFHWINLFWVLIPPSSLLCYAFWGEVKGQVTLCAHMQTRWARTPLGTSNLDLR